MPHNKRKQQLTRRIASAAQLINHRRLSNRQVIGRKSLRCSFPIRFIQVAALRI